MRCSRRSRRWYRRLQRNRNAAFAHEQLNLMAAIKRLFGNFRSSRAKKSDSESHTSIEWVVAGLGNPGEEYSRSRHNAGFMTIDRIAKAKSIELNRRRFKGISAEITLAEKPA